MKITEMLVHPNNNSFLWKNFYIVNFVNAGMSLKVSKEHSLLEPYLFYPETRTHLTQGSENLVPKSLFLTFAVSVYR